jgi:anti-sigma factor RsiW
MSTAPGCDKILLVQAELDGELDAAQAATLAAHRADCPICQAAAAELAHARSLIDRAQLYQPMPGDVRSRLMAQLASASSKGAPTLPSPAGRGGLVTSMRRWWTRWWSSGASFGLGAAAATAVALLVLAPHQPNLADQPNLAEQIVAGHIRALQPGHLEDVASGDGHTVKPWFDGRIDFAPPVKDLAAQRFPLRGGRLDYVAGRPVAALVYQRDKHVIDLFVWPAVEGTARPPEIAQRQGYNVVHWSEDGMMLWAVSDLEAGQLREFAEDWRGMRD